MIQGYNAFYTVLHKPYYTKYWYGIRGGSFLDWRTQCVALDGVYLPKCTVLSDVPQGQSTLFTISRNNLYTRQNKDTFLEDKLQEGLCVVQNW